MTVIMIAMLVEMDDDVDDDWIFGRMQKGFSQCTTELPCTAVNISCKWNDDKNNDYNDHFGIDGENGTDEIFRNLMDWDWCSENIGFTFLHKSYFLAKKILWDWQEVWIALKMSTTSITKWFFSTPKEINHFLSPHFVEK